MKNPPSILRRRFYWILLLTTISTGLIISHTIRKAPYLIYAGNTIGIQILWQEAATVADMIQWGKDRNYSMGSFAVPEYDTDHQHRFTFSNLTPGMKYYYKVLTGDTVFSGSFHAPPNQTDTALKFFVYGDTRSHIVTHDSVAAAMVNDYTQDEGFQTLILGVGDIVSDGDDENKWTEELFDMKYPNLVRLFANIPVEWCRGNHERKAVLFRKYFPYPYMDSCYWSYDYGPAHFVVIDEYTSYAPGSPQYKWLEQDLSVSTKPWKFVYFHAPGWSAGGHENNKHVQEYLEPLFEKYDVPMVFTGHNHYYARASVKSVDGKSVQHITTGGGGAELGAVDLASPNIVTGRSVNHYCKISIINDAFLQFEAVSYNGEVIDKFSIDRNKY